MAHHANAQQVVEPARHLLDPQAQHLERLGHHGLSGRTVLGRQRGEKDLEQPGAVEHVELHPTAQHLR